MDKSEHPGAENQTISLLKTNVESLLLNEEKEKGSLC
jgi:hypothetical protein